MTTPAEPLSSQLRRPGGRTARVTDGVMRATIELLASGGWQAISIEAVAEHAGVHKTTVYRRWPTRGALVAAALVARPFRPPKSEAPDTGTIRGDFTATMKEVRIGMSEPRTLGVIRGLTQASGEPEVAAASEVFWSTMIAETREILDRGKARGEIPRDTNTEIVATMVMGAIKLHLFDRGKNESRRWYASLVDATLAAVNASPD